MVTLRLSAGTSARSENFYDVRKGVLFDGFHRLQANFEHALTLATQQFAYSTIDLSQKKR